MRVKGGGIQPICSAGACVVVGRWQVRVLGREAMAGGREERASGGFQPMQRTNAWACCFKSGRDGAVAGRACWYQRMGRNRGARWDCS